MYARGLTSQLTACEPSGAAPCVRTDRDGDGKDPTRRGVVRACWACEGFKPRGFS